MECDHAHCSNIAKFYDEMHNIVCEECMEREIGEEGADQDSYEAI